MSSPMPDARTEAEILFPDRTITLSDGRKVVVRELSFRESLAWQRNPESFEVVAQCVDGDGFSVEAAVESIGSHFEWWAAFVSAATGLGVEEFGDLPNSAALPLVILALEANALFFGRIAATQSRRNTPSPTPSGFSSDTGTPTQAG